MSMVAAGTAITRLIDASADTITLDEILAAHATLMHDDPDAAERQHAGRVRDAQNWIGGSQHTPRNALYVPPPPELVHDLLDDLIAFSNRDDLEPITQAALAHAQFESIHPFTDGNGRIGRALIGAILRRRGVTPRTGGPWDCARLRPVRGRLARRRPAPGRQRGRRHPACTAGAPRLHHRAARRGHGHPRAQRLPRRRDPRAAPRRRSRHRTRARTRLRGDGRARRVRRPRHEDPGAHHAHPRRLIAQSPGGTFARTWAGCCIRRPHRCDQTTSPSSAIVPSSSVRSTCMPRRSISARRSGAGCP